MITEIVLSGLRELGVEPDERAALRFEMYYNLLVETNKVMNLTAITGEEEAARLHFLDCAALLACPEPPRGAVVDVGTGAGFPGLPLKILRPDTALTLLDSQRGISPGDGLNAEIPVALCFSGFFAWVSVSPAHGNVHACGMTLKADHQRQFFPRFPAFRQPEMRGNVEIRFGFHDKPDFIEAGIRIIFRFDQRDGVGALFRNA